MNNVNINHCVISAEHEIIIANKKKKIARINGIFRFKSSKTSIYPANNCIYDQDKFHSFELSMKKFYNLGACTFLFVDTYLQLSVFKTV